MCPAGRFPCHNFLLATMNRKSSSARSTPNTFGSSQVLLCREGLTVSTVVLAPGSRFAPHSHQLDQLCVVLHGHYEESCGACSRVPLHPGSVVWRRAGELHSNTVGPEEVQAILVDIEARRSSQLALGSMAPAAYFVPGTFDEIHCELVNEAHRSDAVSHLAIEALICVLAAGVRRLGRQPKGATPEWLFKAVALIRSEYSRSIRLSEIAAAARVHRVSLAVAFRHYLGRSVGTYITDLRVAHARRELQTTDRPAADIAQEAGFYDESHMGRVFRRRFRASPGALRSQRN